MGALALFLMCGLWPLAVSAPGLTGSQGTQDKDPAWQRVDAWSAQTTPAAAVDEVSIKVK